MRPLWRLCSGEFAGWRVGDLLYSAAGMHLGYFERDVAHSCHGRYLGEIHRHDAIGRRMDSTSHAMPRLRVTSMDFPVRPNRDGIDLTGWLDPGF